MPYLEVEHSSVGLSLHAILVGTFSAKFLLLNFLLLLFVFLCFLFWSLSCSSSFSPSFPSLKNSLLPQVYCFCSVIHKEFIVLVGVLLKASLTSL